MPRPRLTLRSLMIAVAVVALLLGGFARIGSLERRFSRMALSHRGQAVKLYALSRTAEVRWQRQYPASDPFRMASGRPRVAVTGWSPPRNERAEADWRELVRLNMRLNYHARLTAKYDRAARYPWLSVEPDPPMPK